MDLLYSAANPRNWHDTFAAWSKPASDTEEAKAENAARMIREAVRAYPALKHKKIDVYATGSYRNNTNTKTESDIDVAVVLRECFWYALPGGLTAEMLGLGNSAAYGHAALRDDVGHALVGKFGTGGVTPGDKAFNIHENTYRLDADVAVFIEHRRYTGVKLATGAWEHHLGVEMRPRSDVNKRIINWHDQHYAEGVKRNDATSRRFKRVARILKRLRDEMKADGTQAGRDAAKATPSFLIECLVFNAPDKCFNLSNGTYFEDVKAVIGDLWNATKAADGCEKHLEVSRMKWLFRDTQPWTREQAHEFLLRAWNHVGFK
jgi:hypothetical protein